MKLRTALRRGPLAAAPAFFVLLSAGCVSAPLIKAVDNGDVVQVRAMLDRGANVNEVFSGTTALRVAAADGNDEMVRELLRRGADVNNGGTYTPLYDAILTNLPPKPTTVKILLDAGARVDSDALSQVDHGYNDSSITRMVDEAHARQSAQARAANAPAAPPAVAPPAPAAAGKPWWDKTDAK